MSIKNNEGKDKFSIVDKTKAQR